MTIIPFDFAMPTGLGFIGKPLLYQEDFYVYRDQFFHFCGPAMKSIPYGDHLFNTILSIWCKTISGLPIIYLINILASFVPFILAWIFLLS